MDISKHDTYFFYDINFLRKNSEKTNTPCFLSYVPSSFCRGALNNL